MKKEYSLTTIYIMALIAMLSWGLSFVFIKIVYRYYGPFTVTFIRLIVSALLLYLIQRIIFKKENITWPDLLYMAVLALFEPFIYFVGESYGLLYVSSTFASIMVATIPVITPIFTYLFLKERLTLNGFAGLFLSFIGILILVLNKNLELQYSLKGIFLLLLAVVGAVGYLIMLRKIQPKYSSLTIIRFQNTFGFIYFLPLFLFVEAKNLFSVVPNKELLFSLLFLTIFPSTIAFIFLNIVLKRIGVNKTNIFTNIIPVFTAVFSYLILNESFGPQKILGISVVIAGVFVAQMGYKKQALLQEY